MFSRTSQKLPLPDREDINMNDQRARLVREKIDRWEKSREELALDDPRGSPKSFLGKTITTNDHKVMALLALSEARRFQIRQLRKLGIYIETCDEIPTDRAFILTKKNYNELVRTLLIDEPLTTAAFRKVMNSLLQLHLFRCAPFYQRLIAKLREEKRRDELRNPQPTPAAPPPPPPKPSGMADIVPLKPPLTTMAAATELPNPTPFTVPPAENARRWPTPRPLEPQLLADVLSSPWLPHQQQHCIDEDELDSVFGEGSATCCGEDGTSMLAMLQRFGAGPRDDYDDDDGDCWGWKDDEKMDF